MACSPQYLFWQLQFRPIAIPLFVFPAARLNGVARSRPGVYFAGVGYRLCAVGHEAGKPQSKILLPRAVIAYSVSTITPNQVPEFRRTLRDNDIIPQLPFLRHIGSFNCFG